MKLNLSETAQQLIAGLVLALVAWVVGFVFLDDLNPVWLLLTLVAYTTGLLMVQRPWRQEDDPEPTDSEKEKSAIAAEQTREALRRLELVIDGTSDGVWDWDMRRNVNTVTWSDRAHQILKLERGELGNSFDQLKAMMTQEDRDEFNKALRKHILYRAPFYLEVQINLSGDSAKRYYLIRGKAKFSDNSEPLRMAGSISDITARKSAQEELSHSFYHDNLTDLPNRSWFLEVLAKTVRQSMNITDEVFAVVLVNIDRFKQINDNLGHLFGDHILKEASTRFKNIFSNEELMARVGADDFAFILKGIRGSGDATRFANEVRQQFEAPFEINDHSLYITVSIGIVFSGEKESAPEILQDVNTVLNQAKAKGGNCVEVFTKGMREDENRRYQLVRDLRLARDQSQFYLSYQPLINMKDESLGGFEALIRWKHPTFGDILPSLFIPVAEETGEILAIGEWVLREACKQAKKWIQMGYPDLVMAVNVSAPQIGNQSIAENVKLVLREEKLHPRHLKIELTESVAMQDIERTVSALEQLKNMGVAVAIDDFGTGYSSLSYLQRYPITALKIDQSFVQRLSLPDGASEESEAIVSTIISMARSLHLSIIAEGVESEGQRDFLREKGVDQLQGFLYSRPLIASEIEELMEERWPPVALSSSDSGN